jgi:Domain of Unknown Function (DUF1080)
MMKPIFKQLLAITFSLSAALLSISAHAQAQDDYVDLIDGVSLNNWNILGNANWIIGKGLVEGNKPSGFLVSNTSYRNFIIRAEFWAESNTNSGIFIRCQDPKKITSSNAYEINIWDTRPEQEFSTGAIVDVAKVNPIHKAGGHWNKMEIIANGPQLQVTMNGIPTVIDARDSKFSEGPIALQSAGGAIKFRKLQIKSI